MRYAEVGAGAGGEAVDVCVSTYTESREKVADFVISSAWSKLVHKHNDPANDYHLLLYDYVVI